MKNQTVRKSRPHGKTLSTGEKESLVRIYETNLLDLKEQEIARPESTTVKNTARLHGCSASTLRKIVKDQRILFFEIVIINRETHFFIKMTQIL